MILLNILFINVYILRLLRLIEQIYFILYVDEILLVIGDLGFLNHTTFFFSEL
jgi:hypothetical protein